MNFGQSTSFRLLLFQAVCFLSCFIIKHCFKIFIIFIIFFILKKFFCFFIFIYFKIFFIFVLFCFITLYPFRAFDRAELYSLSPFN